MRTTRWRADVSAALAVVAAVALIAAASTLGLSVGDGFVGTLFVYLASYLVLSVLAYPGAKKSHLDAWRARESRGSFLERYVLGTAPGPGVSLIIATAALVVAVVWLPADNGSALSRGGRVIVALTMAAMAWTAVALSFAITFHADDLTDDNTGFAFPQTKSPQWVDYLYFAVSVMSTFGTTDVDVTSTPMRRTVMVNALIAFVFNTVIVATLVNALAGL